MAGRRSPLPALSELPLAEGDPPNSAWGLWDDAKDASLGSLNYLTDEVVLKTMKEEVQTGERIGLESASSCLFCPGCFADKKLAYL